MPYLEPEASDPHALVGVGLPGDPAATREMARAFAGFPRERILGLFQARVFRAPRAALELLGQVEIQRVVDEAVALWGGVRVRVLDAEGEAPPRRAETGKETPCRR
jgi:hypothetical protein